MLVLPSSPCHSSIYFGCPHLPEKPCNCFVFSTALCSASSTCTLSVSGALFPNLLSEDAAQQGKNLPLALSSVFSSGGWTRYWNPLSPASSASRDPRKATFHSIILEGPLLHGLYFFSYLQKPSLAERRSPGERKSQRL